MKQRNWLELSRKLVDRYDLDFTLSGMSEILGQYALSFFGEGVLATTIFPNPFPITLSGSVLGGNVGTGIAYDSEGMFTSIQSGTPPFTIPTAHASLARKDLLVIRYKQTGDTQVPKPSDPITLIYLNLHDDFELAIIPGTPGSGVYPAQGAADIILSGILVPANAAVGTNCTLDISIREVGLADLVKYPVFKQEVLAGVVDGVNTVFTLSETPISNGLNLYLDGLNNRYAGEFSVSGLTVTFNTPPALGQEVHAWYIVMDASSTNPLAALQELPSGVVNGTNDTFTLAGKPANKEATVVWLNGAYVPVSEWSLVQGPTNSQIIFNTPPELGQIPYVFYFVNPASVGQGNGGGSGGSGAYTPYGTPGAPITVNPLAGITSTVDQRQLLFLTSSGGEVPVTANPQISPGTILGQEMLLRGVSDSDYMVFEDGNGLSLNGQCKLTANQTLPLFWDGTKWAEITRRM